MAFFGFWDAQLHGFEETEVIPTIFYFSSFVFTIKTTLTFKKQNRNFLFSFGRVYFAFFFVWIFFKLRSFTFFSRWCFSMREKLEKRLSKPVVAKKKLLVASETLPDLNESAELGLNGTGTQARPFHLEIQTVFKMKTLSLPLLIDLRAFCYSLAAGWERWQIADRETKFIFSLVFLLSDFWS